MRVLFGISSAFSVVVAAAGAMPLGCGQAEFLRSDGAVGGAPNAATTTTTSPPQGTGGADANFTDGTTTTTTTAVTADPCDGVSCDPGTTCVAQPTGALCAPVPCEEANCSPTEECKQLANGGFVCLDISCDSDVDCASDAYCNGTICVDDDCIPYETQCAGNELLQCPPNGSTATTKYACVAPAYFNVECVDGGLGTAFCSCQDDWDCPAHTFCDVAQCAGTGKPPTCFLPPKPFGDVPPAPEIVWGGTGEASRLATGKPFEKSAQVVMTPAVANLNDDNGDGLINERDFPEIIFVTFCDSQYSSNGVLRAIHGGGVNKGQDYFATCGSTVWKEGDALPTTCATAADSCSGGRINSTAAIAVGDIDSDGVPEIVTVTEGRGLQILRNNGEIEFTSADGLWPSTGYPNPAPAIANIDGTGYAEVVVGRYVFTFKHDPSGNLILKDTFAGKLMSGSQGQGPSVCLANLRGDSRAEIVAGSTVYGLPRPPSGAESIADCAAFAPTTEEETAYCKGELLVAWDGQTVNGGTAIPDAKRDGFCAVADILGVDPVLAPSPQNPLDGKPEVILINDGTLLIFDGATGLLRRNVPLGVGTDGGAPNVDDFDGDGFPEVGTAFGTSYNVLDLQDPSPACPIWTETLDDAVSTSGIQGNPPRTPPAIACTDDAQCETLAPGTACNETSGKCVCLHNGWQRKTEDDSSRVTGSSVFDFNGDGGAEVIYNDECFFRVYDGLTAAVLFKEPSESRTRIEYPVVADVDNDGNAEIVFAASNESGYCSVGAQVDYNNGLEVWGDPSDTWVSARRIWNEHAYHVTNVTEASAIPPQEPENFKLYNGRSYNTYRSNPRAFGTAPDLTVAAVQISSPDQTCGELSDALTIAFQINNEGDLRVGPGVTVRFVGHWLDEGVDEPLHADAQGSPLEVLLLASMEPGESALLSIDYDIAWNTPFALPDTITVVADALEQENECNEDNNVRTAAVEPGLPEADLRIVIDAISTDCPPTLSATVFNDGSAPANNVLVRFYAGDPGQGGTALGETTLPSPLGAGDNASLSIKLTAFPQGLSITVFAIVDPDDTVAECNNSDNKAAADGTALCQPF